MRKRTVALALALLAAACGGEAQRARSAVEADAVVERSGSAVRSGRVGAAALIRVNGDQPRGPIELDLSFLDGEGRRLATTRDSVPFCGVDEECWWGATFFADEYGGKRVERVRVEVAEAEPFGIDESVRRFEIDRAADGSIRGEAPGASGTAFVIASTNGAPRWGTSVNITDDRTVAVPPDLLPALGGEGLSGFFYPGSPPTGH